MALHRHALKLLVAAVMLGVSLSSSAAEPLVDTVAKIKHSVVGVGTFQYTRRPQSKFMGTGFVVGDGRHVITNDHVVPKVVEEHEKEFLAIFTGHGTAAKAIKAEIVAQDPLHDLALLKFEGRKITPFKLAKDKTVKEGQEIAFTGFPIGMVIGLFPVTHRGIVSAITPVIEPVYHSSQLDPNRIRRLRDPYTVYQLDATAYPGNSGSPVYSQHSGRLLGVINKVFVKETKEMVIEKPSGITYAIPSRYVRELMEKSGVKP
ncbi:MAG: S1 family peptidase [Gammaproteobacteria bacterium]